MRREEEFHAMLERHGIAALAEKLRKYQELEAINAELLATVKQCLERMLQLQAEHDVETIGQCPTCERARRAIAMAEGVPS